MIRISLTDFIEYVAKVGTTKHTKVKQMKTRDKYHPAFDFWKQLRDELKKLHYEEEYDKSKLSELPRQIHNKKKVLRYEALVKAYLSFLGRKKISSFPIKKQYWKYNDVSIRVNPELGLKIGAKEYIIKLYFKADKLSKAKAETLLTIMSQVYQQDIKKGRQIAILDIERKKLLCPTIKAQHLVVLQAEVNSFKTIWDAI